MLNYSEYLGPVLVVVVDVLFSNNCGNFDEDDTAAAECLEMIQVDQVEMLLQLYMNRLLVHHDTLIQQMTIWSLTMLVVNDVDDNELLVVVCCGDGNDVDDVVVGADNIFADDEMKECL